jgi:hypothetical protein
LDFNLFTDLFAQMAVKRDLVRESYVSDAGGRGRRNIAEYDVRESRGVLQAV